MAVSNPADLTDARLQTAGGIRYKILKQTLNVSANESQGSETILIRVQDIAAFLLESFPLPTQFNNIMVPSFPRHIPGNAYMLTKNVSIEALEDELPVDIYGIDPSAPSGTYNDVVQLQISYEAKPNSEDYKPDDPTTWLRHSINSGGEYLMIPAKNTEWETSGDVKDFNAPIAKIIPTIEHNLDWDYVLYPPWSKIREQLGTVNDAAIKLFHNAPIGTVLFVSLSGEQTWTTAGAKPWSLSYKFSERHISDNGTTCGWNHVYNPSTNRFEKLQRTTPGSSDKTDLYESSTFADLFKYDEDSQDD